MSVNLLLAENPDFKFVDVQFQATNSDKKFDGKTYTYKTLLNVKTGDSVVVEAIGRLKVVQVVAVIDPYEVDLEFSNYRWVTSVLNTESHDLSVETEKKVNKTLNAMKFASKREELTEQLHKNVGSAAIAKLKLMVKRS